MSRRSEVGTSLLEVVFTMMLLTIALVGLAVVFPIGQMAVLQARISTAAVSLAERRVEEARRTPYDRLDTLVGSDNTSHPPYTIVTGVLLDVPSPRLATVTVTITAPEQPGPLGQEAGLHNVVLETFVGAP